MTNNKIAINPFIIQKLILLDDRMKLNFVQIEIFKYFLLTNTNDQTPDFKTDINQIKLINHLKYLILSLDLYKINNSDTNFEHK